MSAWTHTYVKAKSLPKDIVNKICKISINNINNTWYMDSKRSFKSILKEWLEMHEEEYDYYVNDCKVPAEHMTKEYLTQELHDYIDDDNKKMQDLKLVIEGKITLDKYLRIHKSWKNGMDHPYCLYRNNILWVRMPYEIFRYRHYEESFYGEDGLKTVDSLLKYLENGIQNSIYDYSEHTDSNKGTGLTPQLRQRITDYYSQFGDENFFVYFG